MAHHSYDVQHFKKLMKQKINIQLVNILNCLKKLLNIKKELKIILILFQKIIDRDLWIILLLALV